MNDRCSIGIDLGGTFIKGGLIDLEGKIRIKDRIPTGSREFNDVCRTLSQFIKKLLQKAEMNQDRILGIGIGSPGGIRSDRATISQSPNFPTWKNTNLKRAMHKLGHENLILENDANTAALGENWLGSGSMFDDMAMFTLGTGVGGGVILNRKIWRGQWGMAGELGHLTIHLYGPVCGCGNRGCLESYLKSDAILNEARQMLQNNRALILANIVQSNLDKMTPKDVYEAAMQGDKDCLSLFEKLGRYLGVAIADILNVLNLPIFVIGGGIGSAFDLMEPSIRDEVSHRAFREPALSVQIAKATLGSDAGMFGAAKLVFLEMEQ